MFIPPTTLIDWWPSGLTLTLSIIFGQDLYANVVLKQIVDILFRGEWRYQNCTTRSGAVCRHSLGWKDSQLV